MTNGNAKRTRTRRDAESVGVLRWIFLRGTQALTCDLRTTGGYAYDVCVVPHWDVSSSVIESYDRPADALRRHAEIARYFRQAGWALVRDTSGQEAAA